MKLNHAFFLFLPLVLISIYPLIFGEPSGPALTLPSTPTAVAASLTPTNTLSPTTEPTVTPIPTQSSPTPEATATIPSKTDIVVSHAPISPVLSQSPPAMWLTFDRPMDHASVAEALRAEPAVLLTLSWEANTVIIQPSAPLELGQAYTFTLGKTAVAQDGQGLNADYEWHYYLVAPTVAATKPAEKASQPATPAPAAKEKQPIAAFGSGENVQTVAANGRRAVHFFGEQEKQTLDFVLYRLDRVAFMQQYGLSFHGARYGSPIFEDPILTETWPETARWSVQTVLGAQETVLPETISPGLYLLSMEHNVVEDQIFLIVTHYSLLLKQGKGQIIAWLVDQQNGRSTYENSPEVNVSLYDAAGKLLAQGLTDSDGLAQFDGVADVAYAIADDGNEMVLTAVSHTWHSVGHVHAHHQENHFHTVAHLYTDRPVYKAGQAVLFKAIIRQESDALLTILPEGTAVTAAIYDNERNVVAQTTLTTNHFGTVNGRFDLPATLAPNRYQLEIELGGNQHIQPFYVIAEPGQTAQLQLTTAQKTVLVGETAVIEIEGLDAANEPLASASVDVQLFQLMGHGVSYDPSMWFALDEEPTRVTLDENGRFVFSFDTDRFETTFAVQDEGTNFKGRTVAVAVTLPENDQPAARNFVTLKVVSRWEQIHLDTNGYLHEVNQPKMVYLTLETADGLPINGRDLTLSVFSLNSDWERAEKVDIKNVTTDATGQAATSLILPTSGHYQLVASGHDSTNLTVINRRNIYVFDPSGTDWPFQGNQPLTMMLDDATYQPGETAQLVIGSLFSGPALLTVERANVQEMLPVTLTAPLTVVELPIVADASPNVQVSLSAWNAVDTTLTADAYASVGDSRLYSAQAQLVVPANDKQLQITVTPNKMEYAPNEEATFTVRVTNKAGVPVSAELSLALLEEAVLATAEPHDIPIYDAFYFRRSITVANYDAYAPVRYRDDYGFGGCGCGGDWYEPAAMVQRSFAETAVWLPTLHTDYNGELTITTTLPNKQATWRLTAVATTADTQVGETAVSFPTISQP